MVKFGAVIFVGRLVSTRLYYKLDTVHLRLLFISTVLFDETNSLIEHDTQDKEFEVDLVKKDLSLTQSSMIDNGKAPKGEPSPRFDSGEGGQRVNQSGGSIAEPDLEQNRPTQPDPSRTDMGIGFKIVPEAVSLSIQGRLENVSMDPFIS